MRIRAAVLDDAPAMGRVMVASFLSAHRGQMPEEAWQKRAEEWTPEVSARGWARALAEQREDNTPREVFLVAEDDTGALVGLVSGGATEDERSGATAEIGALYVLPDRHRQGVGGSLLRAASRELAGLGFSSLQLGVLTTNLPARGFYDAMGGRVIGQRMDDDEGYPLPLTVYAWSDIAMAGDPSAAR